MPAEWRIKAKQLAAKRDHEGELRVLLRAGRRGSLEAAAMYARKGWGHLPDRLCLQVLEEVARRVRVDDWATHYALHLAYVIGVGAGVTAFGELMRRSLHHLQCAARARGDAAMVFEVGLHYWHGLNMTPRNPGKAAQWLEAAASTGVPEMVREYKRFLRTQGQSVAA